MATKKITEVDIVNSLSDSDAIFVNSSNSLKQISKSNLVIKGDTGKSAYAYAVEGGFTGTETEFAAKLAEEMPTTLPNPNALTFTGAVTGSYDGSQPLTVNIPSGGGGGREIYEAEFVVDVDTHEFEAELPYKSRVIAVYIKNYYSAYQATTNAAVAVTLDGVYTYATNGPGAELNANWRGSIFYAGFFAITNFSGSGSTTNGAPQTNIPHIGSGEYNILLKNQTEGVQRVGLIHVSGSSTIAAGTTYTVLAERVE